MYIDHYPVDARIQITPIYTSSRDIDNKLHYTPFGIKISFEGSKKEISVDFLSLVDSKMVIKLEE